MIDYSKEWYEEHTEEIIRANVIDYCLEQLFKDDKHSIGQEIVKNLTFEEIIGALLTARDMEAELRMHEG